MSKSKRIVAPFTNNFGVTINPGDKVYAITVCSHRTYISEVEYVGYIERDGYDYNTRQYEKMKFAQVRRPTTDRKAYYEGTDTLVNWSTFNRGEDKIEWRETERFIITTLQYNNIIPVTSPIATLAEAV